MTKTIAELQAANLPRVQLEHFIKNIVDPDNVMPAIRAETRPYLDRFCPPGHSCICCDAKLLGIFGSFTWGMVNGEGFCVHCKWPARAIHRIESESLGKLTISNMVLQYHPDEVLP